MSSVMKAVRNFFETKKSKKKKKEKKRKEGKKEKG
jgi:hypothetical protein